MGGLLASAVLKCDLSHLSQVLDSAIVDCGKAIFWNSCEDDVSVDLAGHFFLPALLVWLLFSLSCPVVHGAVIKKDQKNLGVLTSGFVDFKSTWGWEPHQASLACFLSDSVRTVLSCV